MTKAFLTDKSAAQAVMREGASDAASDAAAQGADAAALLARLTALLDAQGAPSGWLAALADTLHEGVDPDGDGQTIAWAAARADLGADPARGGDGGAGLATLVAGLLRHDSTAAPDNGRLSISESGSTAAPDNGRLSIGESGSTLALLASAVGMMPGAGQAMVPQSADSAPAHRAGSSTAAGIAPAFVPGDPLFATQWHFPLIGDIATIWDEFTGVGVNVGVYDDGIDYTHEDLAANYDGSLHVVDDLGNVVDPSPVAPGDGHGTACAGIIGAANNGVGGVGVAFGTTLTSVNIDFDNTGVYGSVNGPIAPFLHVVGQAAANFDITSHSWGSTPVFFDGLNDGGFADQLDGVYGTLSATGRGGLGTIVVQAAGNDNLDANGSGADASRFTITVAATVADGTAAWYTNYGAGILVAGPAAAVTTDLTGAAGYDPGQYTTTFGGTSAATPVVSGVIALMMQANSGLGWRDVHTILANSASLTGSAFGGPATGFEDGAWYANNATGWNGGGNHLHSNYGYGMVNAYDAVRMAEVWTLFGAAATSATEASVTSGLNDFTDTVLGFDPAAPFTTTFTIGTDIEIEHVALSLDFEAIIIDALNVRLTSADGTVVQAYLGGTNRGHDSFDGNWTFGIDALRGELSAGTWTLQIFDQFALFDNITVRSAALDIYGATLSVDDVYHFTDEFLTMRGVDATRGTITDTNGGFDWLNLAAVQGNIVLDLLADSFTVDSVHWASVASNVFEGVVFGDGDDFGLGGDVDNSLLGMRGNDALFGDAGNDTIIGGVGNDTVDGGDGNDTVDGGTGNDSVYGDDGNDTVYGGGGNDSVYGGVGNDLVVTGTGQSTAYGDAGDDVLNSTDTNGILNNSFYGGSGNDTVFLLDTGTSNTSDGGDDIDTINANETGFLNAFWTFDLLAGTLSFSNSFIENWTSFENYLHNIGTTDERVFGTVFNNVITMNAGNNSVLGRGGDDTVFAGAGNDTVDGGADNDAIYGGRGSDLLDGGTGNDLLDGGIGNDTLTGDIGNDQMSGGNGNDTLYGGAGNDTLIGSFGTDRMEGGVGDDIYYYENLGDVIIEAAGDSADRILVGISANIALIDVDIENMTLTGTTNINGVGSTRANEIVGNSGNNALSGGFGNDTLRGGDGNDTLNGNEDDDNLQGGNGNDTLMGAVGNDRLDGGAGNDALSGVAGNDSLLGGTGNDRLDGGAGNDRMNGGTGDDRFVFVGNWGVDVVTDFTLAGTGERIDLITAIGIVDFADLSAGHMAQVGGNTVITAGINSLTLAGITMANLTAIDFLF